MVAVDFWQGWTTMGIIAIAMFSLVNKKEKEMATKKTDKIDGRGRRRNTTAAKVRRWLKTHVLRIK